MDKENIAPSTASVDDGGVQAAPKEKMFSSLTAKLPQSRKTPKSSSLNPYIQLNGTDPCHGASKPRVPLSSSSDIWDLSDTDAAPASSWSTLPNRSLLLRPLPLDVGRCSCIIVTEFIDGISCYALYTNEGHGRQDRKLAVARHRRRRNWHSEFIIAQNSKGITSSSDDSFLGTMKSNLMGSKYQIWCSQGRKIGSRNSQCCRLLGVIAFLPTITKPAGSFRSMKVCIPKQKPKQPKQTNTEQISSIPKDWVEKKSMADQLISRSPYYNKIANQYELDYREKAGRTRSPIRASVKNFQLSLDDDGRQTILQLGRTGKTKYVVDYRYPLSGYQAFCICLASIDSKLCCAL